LLTATGNIHGDLNAYSYRDTTCWYSRVDASVLQRKKKSKKESDAVDPESAQNGMVKLTRKRRIKRRIAKIQRRLAAKA
jgi:hypothetical protein